MTQLSGVCVSRKSPPTCSGVSAPKSSSARSSLCATSPASHTSRASSATTTSLRLPTSANGSYAALVSQPSVAAQKSACAPRAATRASRFHSSSAGWSSSATHCACTTTFTADDFSGRLGSRAFHSSFCGKRLAVRAAFVIASHTRSDEPSAAWSSLFFAPGPQLTNVIDIDIGQGGATRNVHRFAATDTRATSRKP